MGTIYRDGVQYPAQTSIRDDEVSEVTTWSSSKINNALPAKTAVIVGEIFNSGHDIVKGIGQAIVTWHAGLARIDFNICITESGTANVFDVGMNRDILKVIAPQIPLITPTYGVCIYKDSEGASNPELEGYGGLVRRHDQFWGFGRIYTQTGIYGEWPASQYTAGLRIIGTCYGTYN